MHKSGELILPPKQHGEVLLPGKCSSLISALEKATAIIDFKVRCGAA